MLRRAAVLVAALSSVLLVGALPGTAHAGKPDKDAAPSCEEVDPRFGNSDVDCTY